MSITRSEFDILVPSDDGGDGGGTPGQMPPGIKPWPPPKCPHCGEDPQKGDDDGDDNDGDGEGQEGQEGQEGGEDGKCPHCGGDMTDDDYKGEGGADVKAETEKGYGSKTGDVLDSNELEEIAKRAEKDESNKDLINTMGGDERLSKDADIDSEWGKIMQESHAKHGAGEGMGDLDRLIKNRMTPKVNWRSALKAFVAKIYKKTRIKMPSRRYLHKNIYIWGLTKAQSDYKDVVIAIDTSGSIGVKELNQFGSEIELMAKQKGIKNLYIIYCDSGIPKGGIQHFKKGDDFKIEKMRPKGGGGTSFYPPFEWIHKNIKKPAFVIYFTDSYGDAPKKDDIIVRSYEKRILWVITVAKEGEAKHIEIGEKIFIDINNM